MLWWASMSLHSCLSNFSDIRILARSIARHDWRKPILCVNAREELKIFFTAWCVWWSHFSLFFSSWMMIVWEQCNFELTCCEQCRFLIFYSVLARDRPDDIVFNSQTMRDLSDWSFEIEILTDLVSLDSRESSKELSVRLFLWFALWSVIFLDVHAYFVIFMFKKLVSIEFLTLFACWILIACSLHALVNCIFQKKYRCASQVLCYCQKENRESQKIKIFLSHERVFSWVWEWFISFCVKADSSQNAAEKKNWRDLLIETKFFQDWFVNENDERKNLSFDKRTRK